MLSSQPRTPQLDELLDFAATSYAAQPLGATWHPGDIIWALQGKFSRLGEYQSWGQPSAIEAVARFDGPGELLVETLVGFEDRLTEIVNWAQMTGDGPALSIRASGEDGGLAARLEALGYRRDRPDHVWYRRDLSRPLEPVRVPGFVARDSLGVDPAARAKAHRDAWDDLRHMGIDAKSQFTTEAYLGIASSPVYDPELDILVEEVATSQLVANVCGWVHPAVPVGVFEPMGTHALYRARRLASLALHEGMRRMQARGLRWAAIGTAPFNLSAQKAYLAAGFGEVDRSWWWTKPLSSAPA